jgi:mRNA interferase RelE/StbE
VASYSVFVKKSAAREIDDLRGKKDRQRIVDRIQNLGENPRPAGVEKLSGTSERYRVRQRDYRIVYEVDDAKQTVTIVKISHRKDVYRGLR